MNGIIVQRGMDHQVYDAEFVRRSDITMKELLTLARHHGFDQKLEQFFEYTQAHEEIASMSAWDFLRSAFRQVDCPACIGHDVGPAGCKYCAGTGKVDYHLVSHPMNVHHTARDMRGK